MWYAFLFGILYVAVGLSYSLIFAQKRNCLIHVPCRFEVVIVLLTSEVLCQHSHKTVGKQNV